jgi:peroxiredoxin Q/BCP
MMSFTMSCERWRAGPRSSLSAVRRVVCGAAAALTVLLGSLPAGAALKTGAPAPEFTAQAALGGAVEAFDLKAALAKGPVVLYFFPKAFTSGCTIEAHAFSDHIADFRRYGATVIGVSSDDIETQKRFSTQECRSNFLVASDPKLAIAREYDAVLMGSFANRTSYVIAPDGKVIETFTNLAPLGHIDNALNALRDFKENS